MTKRDVIQRRYLQLKLNRDLRSGKYGAMTKAYIVGLKTWVTSTRKRAGKKAGGL